MITQPSSSGYQNQHTLQNNSNKGNWMVLVTMAAEVSYTPATVVIVRNQLGSNSTCGNNELHGTWLRAHILQIIGQEPMLQTKLSNQVFYCLKALKKKVTFTAAAAPSPTNIEQAMHTLRSALFVLVNGQRRNITYDIHQVISRLILI